MSSFSQRHGYSGHAKEITIREDAPESIRVVVLETGAALGLSASIMRDIGCRILRKRPDANNLSPGNIWREEDHVYGCEWFKVYDLIEAFDKATGEQGDFKKDFPRPLMGFTGMLSDAGTRHGKEGKEPTFDEAQFAVTTCAAVCTLLATTNPKG